MRHTLLILLLSCLHTYVASQGLRFPESPGWGSSWSSPRAPSCDRSSQCLTIRRCPSIRSQPNWRRNVVVCGYTVRGSARICCGSARRTGRRERTGEIRREGSNPVPTVISSCGASRYRSLHAPRIMGGQEAREGQFPWLVALVRKTGTGSESLECTAFVIGMRHVLTAAHCFPRVRPSQFSIKAGSLDWRNAKTYSISEIHIPSGYRHGRFYDDIAVLKLSEPINDPKVTAICMPTPEIARMDLTGREATVAGWGTERFRGSVSNTLKLLSGLPIMSNSECSERLTRLLPGIRVQFNQGINEGFLCAGFMQGRKDSCEGDSGGPLMYWHQGTWYAIGIVSFGYECGNPGYPAGYTRISNYLDYIGRHTRS